jgi:hypothetical protein
MRASTPPSSVPPCSSKTAGNRGFDLRSTPSRDTSFPPRRTAYTRRPLVPKQRRCAKPQRTAPAAATPGRLSGERHASARADPSNVCRGLWNGRRKPLRNMVLRPLAGRSGAGREQTRRGRGRRPTRTTIHGPRWNRRGFPGDPGRMPPTGRTRFAGYSQQNSAINNSNTLTLSA